MCVRFAASVSGNPMMLKCRRNRLDTGLRPPPGGAMAHTSATEMISENRIGWTYWYQPPWSRYCRSSSSGGWAPYCSRWGRLVSSMKIVHVFPAAGPKVSVRRFSNFDIRLDCSILAEVRAEKLMITGTKFSPMPLVSRLAMFTVLPLPVGPTQRVCRHLLARVLINQLLRTVSSVGTSSSWNSASSGTPYSGCVSSHGTHATFSSSKK
mmetsp:Transcript_152657/g.266554  ORF Transcript_152657/g.266554 Transcript_152657/m.266554 type:complete len:209 (-) Transcript_152657:1619-2245(-)